MPIEHKVNIKQIEKDEFYEIDYKIMGLVFDIHNEFGRFWDEKIYQRELYNCCLNSGFEKAATEVPIRVTHKDFQKYYYLDLLINNSVIYELKTVKTLSSEHQKQTLNYLFLAGLAHGKLLNLNSHSVESRFVSTTITPADRFNHNIDESGWQDRDEDSVWIRKLVLNLLHDWGTYLDINLYKEAVIYFRGGEEHVIKPVKVVSGSQVLGYQKMILLNPETAFKISAIVRDIIYYEQHLSRILNHTNLRAIQWINFSHNKITFKTIMS